MNWAHVAYQSAVQAGHPDPEMFVRQMQAESGLRPGAVSPAGAIGIAQIMPATARGWGVDPHDPVESLKAAAKAMTKYMASYNGNAAMALAAYNAGPGAVQKYNGVPPYSETRNYIKKIMAGQGGKPTGPMPQMPQGAPQGPQQAPNQVVNQINRINNAYTEAPWLAKPHIDKLQAQLMKGPGISDPDLANPTRVTRMKEGAGFFTRFPGETYQQYIDRLLQKKFGLQHDPGNSQTTGGRHMVGSAHYRGGASDYGTARNPVPLLDKAANWIQHNADKIVGHEDVIWREPGHHDHLHTEGRKKRDAVKQMAPTPPPITPTNTQRRRPVKRVRKAG